MANQQDEIGSDVGFTGVQQLDDALSEPDEGVVATLGRLEGDILILGVSGKMGPSLARMARRASDAAGVRRRIIGVARFSGGGGEEAELHRHGIETVRCDLLDPDAIARLPDAANVVFMVGRKFGSSGQEALTWAVNCALPSWVGHRYAGSRIVAFSTGNVYGLTPVGGGGSREEDPLNPQGEYAMSCLGRERIFEHVSLSRGVATALIRLNYATDLRYGVLVDLARKVAAGEPVEVAMGYLNTIWQGDANAQTLRAFDHVASPPRVLNVTGPEILSVRETARRFGDLLGRPAQIVGEEQPEALLSNSELAEELFGPPRVNAEQLINWTAAWLARGGEVLDKPTHFEVRDGRF